jgi:hypothetical protein
MTDCDADLRDTVQWLKDLEEIKQLKYRYGRYCDGGWEHKGGSHMGPIADLFVEDGVWDARPDMPIAQGREAIAKLFVEFRKIPFASHHMMNPIIEIDGDTAKGYWRLIGGGEMPGRAGGALFLNGYEDEYVRTPQGWRIKYCYNVTGRVATLSSGWEELGSEPLSPDLDYDAGST